MAKPGKKFTIFGILLVLLAAVFVFGFAGQLGEKPKLPALNQLTAGLGNNGEPATQTSVPEPAAAPPAAAAAISALSNSLKEIVSAKFPVKGALAIQRVWLVGEDYFYVEYQDNRQPRRVLAQATGRAPLQFTALGYFLPGQTDWTLEQGQDKLFKDEVWTLYEFEPAVGAWIKKN